MKECYDLQRKLNVAVAYICVTGQTSADCYAPRFVNTYLENPGGYDHSLTVLCNGGPLSERQKKYFNGAPCDFMPKENDAGWDIGAYQDFAAQTNADFVVCFGESVHFWRSGWLARMVEARLRFGPGMYGFLATHAVLAHLNTTAFGCDPYCLTKYPRVLNHAARYEFEHGEGAMWRRIQKGGGAAVFVTRNHFLLPGEWRSIRNGLWEGDQSECMVRCNHMERFEMSNPATKLSLTELSNVRFK